MVRSGAESRWLWWCGGCGAVKMEVVMLVASVRDGDGDGEAVVLVVARRWWRLGDGGGGRLGGDGDEGGDDDGDVVIVAVGRRRGWPESGRKLWGGAGKWEEKEESICVC
ncbi:hypothetical protein Tco_1334453 [Tanacetum coccineum]